MDEEDLEFEGDSEIGSSLGSEVQASKRPRESQYGGVVGEWAREHPEASVRVIREDADEACVVLELQGTQLEVYVPQEDDANFFVTTDSEDSLVNSVLTELNDMPQLRTLPEFLAVAFRLLGRRGGGLDLTSKSFNNSFSAEELKTARSALGLSGCKSATVLSLEKLQEMQASQIARVCERTCTETHVAALLLLHCSWAEQSVLQSLSQDGDAMRCAAGVALPAGENPAPSPQLCSVCFVDEALDCLPCGHGLCQDDWPGFLKCNLESGTVGGQNCLRLKCPGERCRLLVPSSHFQKYLEPEDFSRYSQLQVLSFVNDNPDIVWCPAAGCELAVGFSKRKSTVKCDCGHRFCFSCKQPAHAPAKCSSAKAWSEKNEKMKDSAPVNACPTAKPCPNPNCMVLSHKESGCHYLQCPSCKENWCWQCGDWGGGPSQRPQPHHVFDCNNPINKEWAKTSSSLFTNEGRYWFYFERHTNHLNSLSFARDLRDTLPDKAWGGVECNPDEICREYSSVMNHDVCGTGACRSMLDSPEAWTAARHCPGEWMQIDLGAVQLVVGIVLQGYAAATKSGDLLQAWVSRVRVESGSNSFKPDNLIGEFAGSTDAPTRAVIYFQFPTSARYIRITPLSWERQISMRAGVVVINEDITKQWVCTCTLINTGASPLCEACGEAREDAVTEDCGASVKRRQDARDLVLDAAELLVECRLVLAWTYVWAFFETDSMKRELFEFVQKDLEKKTEEMSATIENQPLEGILRDRLKLLDSISALRGYVENMKEYTAIDPDAEVPTV